MNSIICNETSVLLIRALLFLSEHEQQKFIFIAVIPMSLICQIKSSCTVDFPI